MSPRERWSAKPGETVSLTDHNAGSVAGAPGDHATTEAALLSMHAALLSLQDRLWAEERRSLLVVLQGIDTSGKDGTISHVFRGLNPLGTRVASFKAPSPEELSHDFLWRVHTRCPAAGEIGIFNRSHYEDVLAVRVHDLVAPEIWRGRYAHINAFEAMFRDAGTTVVKIFLHISKDEQLRRLNERLNDDSKQWKAKDADFAERKLWDRYVVAFEEMIEKTSTHTAPWYVVPADHKWYRNWAVSTVLIETLTEMDPHYPEREESAGAMVAP